MSENYEAAQTASQLVSKMIALIDAYEKGTVNVLDNEYPLTAQQVTDLKQQFAAARTACIAALNSITAQ